VKHYWIKLFRDERGEELVENFLINALLVGLVWRNGYTFSCKMPYSRSSTAALDAMPFL
jgi:hypothetical protein